MSGIPDETLLAFADGTLPDAEALRVADAIEADPALAERVRLLAEGRRIAAGAFASVLAEPVPARLVAAASAAPPAPPPANDNRWRGAGTGVMGVALGLAAGLLLATILPAPPQAPGLPAAVVAALDGRGGGEVRVAGAWRVEGGAYCRGFEAPEPDGVLRGLACREGGGWRLRIAVGGGAGGQFRPASGEDPLIVEMLERLGAGAPLSEAEAAEAARRGWR
ncbi:MAG: anti-sigma factor family protein [Acetobacteraceae bacterium]